MNLQTTKVFKELWANQDRINLLRGGARSSKSWSVMQLIFLWLMTGYIGKNKIPIGRFTVVRSTFPALRITVLRDFINYLHEMKVYSNVHHSKSTHTFEYNGREVIFFSLDDAEKMKGIQHTCAFINEADAITFEAFTQIAMRTEHFLFLDCNPSNSDSWVKERIEDNRMANIGDVNLMVSTFRMNPYLPEAMITEIENLKHTDQELYDVYAKGQWTKLTGLIFKHWEYTDYMPMTRRVIGIDFGFNDPTAIVEICIKIEDGVKHLYVHEHVYERELLTSDIITALKELPIGNKRIIADAADPKAIEQIRRAGFSIKASRKGKDSVRGGIDAMRQYKLHITEESVNIVSELKKYKWKKDNEGNQTSEPIDMFNHAIDSIRYAHDYLYRRRSFKLFV